MARIRAFPSSYTAKPAERATDKGRMTTAAQRELQARISWTLARIGEVANQGRDEGWLHGRATNPIDSDACRDLVDVEAETAMRTAVSRLGLSEVELDVLWLLACVELEPHAAHAAQAL